MPEIASATLEVLRLGPPHNQLLSPLTQYIAQSGKFEVREFRVPWEHKDFLDLLAGLRYEEDKAYRRSDALKKLGKALGELLDGVPGVVKAINGHADGRTFLNLEVVVSAGELAQLPFEAAYVPNNCEAAGTWLSLQGECPVVVTRRVRTVSGERTKWPPTPRVLMVAAQPGSLSVPLRTHVKALSDAVQPFVRYSGFTDEGYLRAIQKMLTVLPSASLAEIREACTSADPPFTHVHVLAHGAPTEDGSYGLLLEKDAGGEVVSGDRFALALRDGQNNPPSVVTVAACDSGNVGDVVQSGASFAHELHQAQIPFVVASQLPLTFKGSERMVRALYEPFLWGGDPRPALFELREELFALDSVKNHDWASIVCYAALPTDFTQQLNHTRYRQAKKASGAALVRFEGAIRERHEEGFNEVRQAVDRAMALMPDDPAYSTEVLGLKGGREKQISEAHLWMADHPKGEGSITRYRHEMLEHLTKASRYYRDAAIGAMRAPAAVVFEVQIHWVLTQHLVLEAVLGNALDVDKWVVAKESALVYLDHPQERIWANGTLAELYMLRPHEYRTQALDAARRVTEYTAPGEDARHSTVRQFRRYLQWWDGEHFRAALALKGKTRDDWDAVVELAGEIDAVLEGDETMRVRGGGG